MAKEFKLSVAKLPAVAKHLEHSSPDEIRNEIEYVVKNTDPSALLIGYHWLGGSKLPELDQENDHLAIHTAFELVDLYDLARIYDSRDLQNEIMDRLKSRDTCPKTYPGCKLVRRIYKYTDGSFKLRHFAIDTFVYKADRWPAAEVDSWLETHMRYGNEGFVKDVKKAQKKLRRGGKRPEDPNRSWKCHYHHHFDGQSCA